MVRGGQGGRRESNPYIVSFGYSCQVAPLVQVLPLSLHPKLRKEPGLVWAACPSPTSGAAAVRSSLVSGHVGGGWPAGAPEPCSFSPRVLELSASGLAVVLVWELPAWGSHVPGQQLSFWVWAVGQVGLLKPLSCPAGKPEGLAQATY